MRLPSRSIHFIWAGGEKIMPPENRLSVYHWAAENPSFEVVVWVDAKTTSLLTLEKYFSKNPTTLFSHTNIVLQDITTEEKFSSLEELRSKYFDIRTGIEDRNISRLVSPYIRYELDRLDANYGRSSDLLRYRILYEIGGAYFDSDVLPGIKNLETLYQTLTDRAHGNEVLLLANTLLIGEKSQNSNALGNDVFVSSPGHSFMQDLIQISEARYHFDNEYWLSYPDQLMYVDRYSTVTILDRDTLDGMFVNRTLHTTGPEAVKYLCGKKAMLDSSNFARALSPIEEYSLSVDYYQPFEENTFSWIHPKKNDINLPHSKKEDHLGSCTK